MLQLPGPQGNKIKQSLWVTVQPVYWDLQVNTQHLTHKLPVAVCLGKNNNNYMVFIISDWPQYASNFLRI